jgi:hypothetical protein
MYPRDSILPPGESVNCHCIHRGIVSKDVLGLSLDERKRLQQEAIDADDGAWEKELDARNKAKAGIEEPTVYKPDETRYNDSIEAKALLGAKTSDGEVIAAIKPHFFDRMEERNVSVEGITNALQSSLHVTEIKYNVRKEPSKQYIGRDVTVAYNPDTKTAVTNWRTGSHRKKKYEGGGDSN